jgi:hypothetical protein
MYPNGIVGTETLIPEEEDEDDYTINNNRENEQTPTVAEHEQPTITQHEDNYTINNDGEDEQSNTNAKHEQPITTQLDEIENEDDRDSAEDIEGNVFAPVTDDQPPPHHTPPTLTIRRSIRNRFPTSRFKPRARRHYHALFRIVFGCPTSSRSRNRQFVGTNTYRPTTTNT